MIKKYIIIDSSELDNLDFSELTTTSKDTARKNLDGTKALVSFYEIPAYFFSATTYTNEQILEILNNSEWHEEE